MLRYVLTTAIVVAFSVPALAAQNPNATNATQAKQPKEFLAKAAKGNQGEIWLGMLAEKQAEHPAVKGFARLLVDDHMAAESMLAATAKQEGVKLPNGVTHQDQQLITKLEGMSGNQFDQQFIKQMVADHQKDISEYKQEMQSAKQGAIGSYVTMTLPVLKQHLALAQAIEQQVGATNQAAATTNPNETAANTQATTK